MLLRYFLNDFEMVPDTPITNGITPAFTFHMRCTLLVGLLNPQIDRACVCRIFRSAVQC
jgi:hypothetical protein